jgi:DNA-binding MarR family transcriptional regulator
MTSETTFNAKVLQLVFNLSRSMKKEFHPDAAQKDLNLSMVQVQALKEISLSGKCAMSDIAHQLCIALPTATVLINKLVALGLVKRTVEKKDRRITCLVLTPVDKEKIDKIVEIKIAHAGRIINLLDDKDKKDLLRILENLSDKISSR